MSVNATTDRLRQPLPAIKERLSRISALVDEANSAIENLKTDGNFPKARIDASHKLTELQNGVGATFASDLRMIYQAFVNEAIRIFEMNDWEVTSEGLTRLNAWLPTNSLHQYAYLNLHEFSKAVNALDSDDAVLEKVNPDSFMYTAADDMSATAILTRTFLFTKGLRDADRIDYWLGSFAVAASVAEKLETEIDGGIKNAYDAINSDKLEEVKIMGINNPAMENAVMKMLDEIQVFLNGAKDATKSMERLVDFYGSLADCFGRSEEAITLAYQEYEKAQAITF